MYGLVRLREFVRAGGLVKQHAQWHDWSKPIRARYSRIPVAWRSHLSPISTPKPLENASTHAAENSRASYNLCMATPIAQLSSTKPKKKGGPRPGAGRPDKSRLVGSINEYFRP